MILPTNVEAHHSIPSESKKDYRWRKGKLFLLELEHLSSPALNTGAAASWGLQTPGFTPVAS